jgi:uncharacterized protein HemY
MNPIIEALLNAAEPADTSDIVLLDRLLNDEITPADLLAAQDDLEAAADHLNALSEMMRNRVNQCLKLSPQPTKKVIIGF